MLAAFNAKTIYPIIFNASNDGLNAGMVYLNFFLFQHSFFLPQILVKGSNVSDI